MHKTDVTAKNSGDTVKQRGSASFYGKLFFLYFLNIVDWLCTEALIDSGRFYEANPIMQPMLENPSTAFLMKAVLPLVMVLICAVIYKLSGIETGFWCDLILYIGIIAYALVNLWHIANFLLLFFIF